MKFRLIVQVCIVLFIVSTLQAINRPKRYAHITSHIKGFSSALIVSSIDALEILSREKFMHAASEDSDVQISLSWDGMMGAGILGEARSFPGGKCSIGLSPVINPKEGLYSDSGFVQVVIHEIGHCFGLKHTEGSYDIMSTYFDRNLETDNPMALYEFVAALNKIRGL